MENLTKSPCKEVCYQHYMKLKDAEKTIANKDVIIKMLQEQVKKLEESYKQNLRQTEDYRYKFCVAAEQIKKLRACRKVKDECSEKQDDEKDDQQYRCDQLAPHQSCSSSISCHYVQQIQNIERITKAQYELLQTLVEKVSDKSTTEEIDKLQQEIKQLKEENTKLQEQIEETDTYIAPKVTDSLLAAYRKTTEGLQTKYSELLQRASVVGGIDLSEQDNDADDECELSNRRVSFSSHKEKSADAITCEFRIIKREGSKVEDSSQRERSFDEAEGETKPAKQAKISVVEVTDRKDVASMTENSSDFIGQTETETGGYLQDASNADKKESVTTNESQTEQVQEATIVAEKLNDIADKVTELLDKQTDTCREIELLKSEMTVAHDTTKACNDNISQLKDTIDQQKETFLGKFQEHREVTDNLTKVNDEIQQELVNLKSKIEILFGYLYELKNAHKISSDDLITIEACRREILKLGQSSETVQSLGVPTQYEEKNDLQQIEEQSSELKKENEETERQIEKVSALISDYTAENPQETENVPKPCSCGDNNIHEYIEEVKSENLILKSTISSVIGRLNEKMAELKSAMSRKEREGSSCTNTTKPCDCGVNETSSVGPEPELEIEDIYNAVRRTYAPKQRCDTCLCNSMSYGCFCNESEQDIYDSVFCTCGSQNCNLSLVDECITETPDAVKPCVSSEHSLMENLETYVSYLYEQLNIISAIESRIEDLRGHIKKP